jgi:hypothetical protein
MMIWIEARTLKESGTRGEFSLRDTAEGSEFQPAAEKYPAEILTREFPVGNLPILIASLRRSHPDRKVKWQNFH